MMRTPSTRAALLALALSMLTPATARAVDLRVDADRDGLLTAADDALEDVATTATGALVLANIDDDGRRCAADLRRRLSGRLTLRSIVACNDAADDVVNGPEDALDLARVRLLPTQAPSVSVHVEGAPEAAVRVFVRHGASFAPLTGELAGATLRSGVELAVEATDVVRDPAVWDGGLRLVAEAPGEAGDVVAMHVAPLLAVPATQPAERLLSARPASAAAIATEVREHARALRRQGRQMLADKRTGRSIPKLLRRELRSAASWERHVRAAGRRLRALREGQRAFLRRLPRALGTRLRQQQWSEDWVQDAFEPAFAALPTANGPQTMRVALIAGGLNETGSLSPRNPAAVALSRIAKNLRGADAAVVANQIDGPTGRVSRWDTTGTMEATPPVPGAPRGRLIVGRRGAALDAATAALIAGQGGVQPPLELDTGWLDIGHSDETIAFVPAATPRGWALLVADPAGALQRLRGLPKRTPVRPGLRELDGGDAELTAGAILAGPVGRASRFAADRISAQLELLTRELALGPEDVVRVPVLFEWSGGKRVVAFTGNIVNGVAPGGRRFVAPLPHGPRRGGEDLFSSLTAARLRAVGVSVRWVDTWTMPHLGSGELHCMTNALRELGASAAWWAAA